MDNALDNLEKRLDALDHILGPDAEGKKLVESLTSAESFVKSAINSHENIKTMSNRTNELDIYLNQDFQDDQQKFSRYAAYINSFSTELQTTFLKLEEIKSLESTLGAEYFRNIPGSSEGLKKLLDKNIEFKESQTVLEEEMMMSMKKFAEIEQGLVNDLANMNSRLDVAQEKIEKHKKEKGEY